MDQNQTSQILRNMNYHGFVCKTNRDLGYEPYFQNRIAMRQKNQLAVNVAVVGEAGISKSYTAMSMCRVISPEKFGIDDIVSTYSEYMGAILKGKDKNFVPIEFDEPQYALDKRDWYNQLNKALVKSITSVRFRLRPIFIPIINISMLDKVLRSYLIQFQVILSARGRGVVYSIAPSHFEEKIYRTRLCRVIYGLFDHECGTPSCLTCGKLNPFDVSETCNTLRALYERKKSTWQSERDEGQYEQARLREMPKINERDVLAAIDANYDNITTTTTRMINKNKKQESTKLDIYKLMRFIEDKFNSRISRAKAYELRTMFFFDYPAHAPEIIEVIETPATLR